MALQIWQHITTVSFVLAFIFVSTRKPKNASRHVLMGPKHNLVHFKSLLCTLPGQRPDTAEGGERARPGRVLVFFGHFFPCTYKVRIIKRHWLVTTGYYKWLLLLLHIRLLHMFTINYSDWLQLATGIWSANIGSGKWKPFFGATYLARVYF